MHDVLGDYTFLLAGFGSEYSLQPIAHYLAECGLQVITADFQKEPLPSLPSTPIIFISSQHPSCSSFVFKKHWGQDPPYSNYVGPREIIQKTNTKCAVFIPHDLEMPVRLDEIAYMGSFDIYCTPTKNFNPALNRICKVVSTGWIKHNDLSPLPIEILEQVSEKGIFFLNQVVMTIHQGGAATIKTAHPQLFTERIPMKLPAWPGCNHLGKELAKLGAVIIPDHFSSTKLIDAAKMVFVNAMGSVVAEAEYLGKPVLRPDASGNFKVIGPATSFSIAPAKFDFDTLLSAVKSFVEEHTRD